jgi:hypothetical protein
MNRDMGSSHSNYIVRERPGPEDFELYVQLPIKRG